MISKRVALVTGGIGGIGTAVCIKLVNKDRLATTTEIAQTVAFLCLDQTSNVTGANIHVNVGMYTG